MLDADHLSAIPVPALPPSYWTKTALSRDELDAEVAKIDPNPSEAQKKSGNYKKGHVIWKGLGLTIETGKGQTRSGVSKDGKPWSITMKDHYGYIKRTESEADGDHIDIFLSGDEDLRSELIFIVNQADPDTGKFDEHKCILGCVDEESAKAAYLRNYADDWQGFDGITPVTLAGFKWWCEHADTSKPIRDGLIAAPGNRKKAASAEVDVLIIRDDVDPSQ